MNKQTLKHNRDHFNALMDSITAPGHVRTALAISKHCDKELEVLDAMLSSARKLMDRLNLSEALDGKDWETASNTVQSLLPVPPDPAYQTLATLLRNIGTELESDAPGPLCALPYDALEESKPSAALIRACGVLVEA